MSYRIIDFNLKASRMYKLLMNEIPVATIMYIGHYAIDHYFIIAESNPTKLSLAAQRDAKRRAQCRGANEIGNSEGSIIIPFVSKYPLIVWTELFRRAN